MKLEQVTGVSKKTGKKWSGFCISIGKYKTPLFFPSEVELWYIESYLKKSQGQNNNGDVE